MTDAERLLWRLLRNRQISGFKFRRQHPIGPFIADFACLEKKIIIELDGGQHASTSARDAKRSYYLEAEGFQVMRFWNNEVLFETDAVLNAILERLEAPSPRPSPPEGSEGVFKGGAVKIRTSPRPCGEKKVPSPLGGEGQGEGSK